MDAVTDEEHVPHVVDWDARGEEMERAAELDLDWLLPAVRWLKDHLGEAAVARIVDLGSGPGVAAAALAAVFPEAAVTAADGSRPLLERAAARADRLGVGDQVTTLPIDLGDPAQWATLPRPDLVWVSGVLHHLPDPARALGAIRDRLGPGGALVAVEGGLPVRWAPDDLGIGRPGLQSRLDAAVIEGLAALPPPHTVRLDVSWPAMLRSAGFLAVETRSWLQELPAPTSDRVRARIRDHLGTLRRSFGDRLTDDDLATVDRLLDPADPRGLAHRDDLFWLTARTLHIGRVQ
jgi:SAM-dependent methyltransferase